MRGISDRLSGKTETADGRWQPTASRHAAAFAFELLARRTTPPTRDPPRLFAAEATLDDTQADKAYEAGRALEMGWDSTVEDLIEIERLYRGTAAAGHADAMARVGLIVEGRLRASTRGEEQGSPSPADLETAKHWYTRSAELGSAFGALYLGRPYEERLGKPAEALKWYEKAAAAGHGGARSRLGGPQRRLALRLGALAGHTPFDIGSRERKPMPVDSDHERWIKQEWGGSEPRAIAFCLGALEETCGGPHGEWGTLSESEAAAVLGRFSTLMPIRVHLPAVAFEYYDHVGEGNLRTFAAELRTDRHSFAGAEELAPVWSWQRSENRVSTEEYVYNVELTVQDYDWLTSLLGSLIENMMSERAPDARRREILLSLRMITRILAERREQAVPAATGDGKWEFSLLLTREYLGILLDVATLSRDQDSAPSDFREFWQRVHDAVTAAVATPFENSP